MASTNQGIKRTFEVSHRREGAQTLSCTEISYIQHTSPLYRLTFQSLTQILRTSQQPLLVIEMAQPTSLVAEGDMKRIRECGAENEILARCWRKSHVALVAMEWAPSGLAYSWNGWIARNELMGYWEKQEAMPVLSVEVTAPESPAGPGSESQPSSKRNAACDFRLWLQSSRPQSVIRMREDRWRTNPPSNTQSSFVSMNEAVTILKKLFNELSSTHSTICVCSHRPSLTQRGLAEIGFKLPKATVFVDMIKVLEYQSRFRPIPPKLKGYMNSCLDVDRRNGLRLAERFDANDGDALALDFDEHAPKYGQPNEWREMIRKNEDLSAGAMLKFLGAEAGTHRRQINKMEKETLALERAMKYLGSDEAKEVNRRAKRALKKKRALCN